MKNIRRQYKLAHTDSEKRHYANLCASKLLTRYRMIGTTKTELGISPRMVRKSMSQSESHAADSIASTRIAKRKHLVRDFFISDEASRVLSGKKETVTKSKLKKQKRILNDSLLNLYSMFKASEMSCVISYSMFCTMRPFWVVPPSQRDRQTCLCITHENMDLRLSKLNQLKAIPDKRATTVLAGVACDVTAKSCMYGDCTSCSDLSIEISKDVDASTPATWQEWKSIKEERDINGSKKQVTITKKIMHERTLVQLVEIVNSQLPKFKRHQFNMHHQQAYYKQLRDSLQPDECMIHIDYAENYLCKSAREVQAAHFGASHRQVTLHTGIYYVGSNAGKSFCTISDSRQHGPAAVWCHLQPILTQIREVHPAVTTVHFFSDGSTSQYKQKGNFLLFSKIPLKFGFTRGRIMLYTTAQDAMYTLHC